MENSRGKTATIDTIDKTIQDIDAQIFNLRKQKRELEIQKEKLKEKNFAEKSLALLNKNWTDGKYNLFFFRLLREINNFPLFSRLSMVF